MTYIWKASPWLPCGEQLANVAKVRMAQRCQRRPLRRLLSSICSQERWRLELGCGCRGGCVRSGQFFKLSKYSSAYGPEGLSSVLIYWLGKGQRGSDKGLLARRRMLEWMGINNSLLGTFILKSLLDIQVGIWRYLLVNTRNLGRDWGWRITFRHHAG